MVGLGHQLKRHAIIAPDAERSLKHVLMGEVASCLLAIKVDVGISLLFFSVGSCHNQPYQNDRFLF